MLFWIAFNREQERDKELSKVAEQGEGEHGEFYKEIVTLEDLEKFEKEVGKAFGVEYSLIVGFDSPTIFLDKDV